MSAFEQIVKDPSRWFTAIDAVHFLAPKLGGDRRAKKAITERLRDSGITCTASWMAFAVDIGRPYLSKPVVFEYEDNEMPPKVSDEEIVALGLEAAKPRVSTSEFGDGLAYRVERINLVGGAFWASGSKADEKRWDWRTGFFLRKSPAGSWMANEVPRSVSERFDGRWFSLGVKFLKDDIGKIAGEKIAGETAPVPTIEVEKRGAKLSELWPDWVAEVVLLHHETGLSDLTATKLVREVEARLIAKGLEPPAMSTVSKSAQRVIEGLRKA